MIVFTINRLLFSPNKSSYILKCLLLSNQHLQKTKDSSFSIISDEEKQQILTAGTSNNFAWKMIIKIVGDYFSFDQLINWMWMEIAIFVL